MRRSTPQHQSGSGSHAARLAAVIAVMTVLLLALWYTARHYHPSGAPATAPTTRPIRIATWNIRKFSERGNPDIVTIARIIRESRFDLLAIQEVQQQGQAAQRLRRQLNEPWRIAISERTGNNERYAFLYRSDAVELLGEPHLLDSPDLRVFQRAPFRGDFRAGSFDFILLTVHLSYTDALRRRQEAQALAQYAAALAESQSEKDIVILGDFNDQGRGNLHLLEARGWTRLNRFPTNLNSKEVYDNILINSLYSREWLGTCGVVVFDELYFNNDDKRASDDVSDHRPVWADFATAGPDDD